MARKIIAVRFYERDSEGKLHYNGPTQDEMKLYLGERNLKDDLMKENNFSELTVNDIRVNLRNSPLFQVMVHSGTKPNYWLDSSWFLERGYPEHYRLERILNDFDDTNFPPQKTVDIRKAYCVDAVQWDFKLKPIKIGVHETIPIPEEDKPDYLVRKSGIDYKHLCQTSLFTVNGFVHDSAYGEEGIYVRGGYQTSLNAKEINVGIICFEDISKLKIHAITENNLIYPVEDLSHLKAFYLKFDQQDFTNKNLALVLGGYLHFVTANSKVVKKVGQNTLRIDSQEFHYHRRVKEIVKSLDKKKRLGMTPYHDERWNNREIEDEKTLKAMLNLSQTFLVEFTTTSPFFIEKRQLHAANYPKRYFDNQRHYPLLRLADGRYPAYLLRDDKNGFVIATTKNTKCHKFDDTASTWKEPFVTDYDRTTFEEEVQKGYFVDISSVTVVDERKNNFEGQVVREEEID